MSFNRLWHHPESDSYFIGEPGEWQNSADGALCNDVTDIEWHVGEAKQRGVEMTEVNKLRSKLTREDMAKHVAELVEPAIIRALMEGTKTCITCDHFNLPNEVCGMYNMRPPAKVIAFGCPAYENEIPF